MTFIDLYKLGDKVYTYALINTIIKAIPDQYKYSLVESEYTSQSPIPDLLRIDRITTKTLWHKRKWYSSPLAFCSNLYQSSKAISEMELLISVRGGLIEQFLVHFSKAKLKIFPDIASNHLIDIIRGYEDIHVFESRERLLNKILAHIPNDITCSKIQWPYLDKYFQITPISNNVLLCPEGGFRYKEWNFNKWDVLIGLLKNKGYDPIVVINSKDSEYRLLKNCEIWQGTILELGNLIASSCAMIAVDSFPGHYSAAMGIPVLSLFGVTSPELWRPWGEKNRVVQSPLKHKIPNFRSEYERHGPVWMNSITVEAVFDEFSLMMK